MSAPVGIIHEIGDYSDIEPLSPEDQKKVHEQYKRRAEEDQNKKVYRG